MSQEIKDYQMFRFLENINMFMWQKFKGDFIRDVHQIYM